MKIIERVGITITLAVVLVVGLKTTRGAEKKDKVEKARIAVADFKVVGNVGIKDAGRTVAKLLLTNFNTRKHQPVERAHLVAILKAHDLTMAEVVADPTLLRGKKIKGLKYLVVGFVIKFGDLSIIARVVDVTTGDIGDKATVSADSARALKGELSRLSKVLTGEKPEQTPSDPHEKLMVEIIRGLEALGDVMAGVTDKASAQTARPRILAITERIKSSEIKMKKIGEPDKKKQDALEAKYKGRLTKATSKIVTESNRIKKDSAAYDILKPNKHLVEFIERAQAFLEENSSDPHEELVVEVIEVMGDLTSILEGVTDKASAQAAKLEIEKIGDRMKVVQKKMKELGNPDKAKEKAMKEKYEDQMMEIQKKMQEQMGRLSKKPECLSIISEAMMKAMR